MNILAITIPLFIDCNNVYCFCYFNRRYCNLNLLYTISHSSAYIVHNIINNNMEAACHVLWSNWNILVPQKGIQNQLEVDQNIAMTKQYLAWRHRVPGVVICPYIIIYVSLTFIGWWVGEIANGLIAAASGAFVCWHPISPT